MNNILIKYMPRNMFNKLRKIKLNKRLVTAYKYDMGKFTFSMDYLKYNKTFETYRALITLYSHAIEKGLSNKDLRYGFGKNNLSELLNVFDEYMATGFPKDDIRFQTALAIVDRYIEINNAAGIDTEWLSKKMSMYPLDEESKGGEKSLTRDKILQYTTADFKTLAENRHSVRDFSTKPVSIEIVQDAIQIATRTPSACNRQFCKVHYVRNKSLVDKILAFQGGIKGFAQNVDSLLVVTADNQYLTNYTERNQGFIDGGMFAMSLLYALEYKGVACCPLNAALEVENEIKIKEILNIKSCENLIEFIAIGNYPDKFKVAMSVRDTGSDITNTYN